jgi:hypothetical protein
MPTAHSPDGDALISRRILRAMDGNENVTDTLYGEPLGGTSHSVHRVGRDNSRGSLRPDVREWKPCSGECLEGAYVRAELFGSDYIDDGDGRHWLLPPEAQRRLLALGPDQAERVSIAYVNDMEGDDVYFVALHG